MKRDIDVLVSEVGPRDGLQSIQTVFTTDGKMEWIRSEAAAGVPQMPSGADASRHGDELRHFFVRVAHPSVELS